MRIAAAALLCLALTGAARAEELTLESSGLPQGATVVAFTGVEKPMPGSRTGDVVTWNKLTPGMWSVEITCGSLDIIGVDMKIRDLEKGPIAVGPLPASDQAAIRGLLVQTTDVFSRSSMPLIMGVGDRAAALIENINDGSSKASRLPSGKGFLRLDVWELEKSGGAWARMKMRVILKRIVDAASLKSTTFIYASELGGLWLDPGETLRVTYPFPAQPGGRQSGGDKENK